MALAEKQHVWVRADILHEALMQAVNDARVIEDPGMLAGIDSVCLHLKRLMKVDGTVIAH